MSYMFVTILLNIILYVHIIICTTNIGIIIILTPVPAIGDPTVTQHDLILPSVILCNPFVTYSNVIEIKHKKCATCGMPMHESAWTDGSSGDTQPRCVRDLHRKFFLVSAIYVCDANHRTLAHDDSILKLFPVQDLIPFVLFHRTGFTQKLASMCVTLISRRMTPFEIELLIIQTGKHMQENRVYSHFMHLPHIRKLLSMV